MKRSNKVQNGVCIGITLMPVAVLVFLYNSIVPNPSTHIWGSGGLMVSKAAFAGVVLLASVLFYAVSIALAKSMPMLTERNRSWIRVIINILFSDLLIWLILTNTK